VDKLWINMEKKENNRKILFLNLYNAKDFNSTAMKFLKCCNTKK
jgi:hypothetical protein